jgi:myo-inositol-1(or 4)-monophosphatase
MNSHLELATAAAFEAGKLVFSMLGKSIITQKGATYNLVTSADTASERLIAEMITQNFPDSEILGEENHIVKDLSAPKLWVVDPLDGTNNFAHGIPQFSISIAYAEFGKVLAGVVYDPTRDEIFTAERGKGAWLNGKPISVSGSKTFSESIIATGFYYDRGDLLDNTIKAIYRLFKSNIQCVRRMGSAALDLSYVACGRFDAYYEYMLSSWDFAAGTLILEEAGGVWSDREGCESGLQSKGILCSNGMLQKDFLKVVKYSTVAGERIGL